jgi:hypothetical protein
MFLYNQENLFKNVSSSQNKIHSRIDVFRLEFQLFSCEGLLYFLVHLGMCLYKLARKTQ